MFPILETTTVEEDKNILLIDDLAVPDLDKSEVEGWEVLPSSSYAGTTKLYLVKKMFVYTFFRFSNIHD